MLFEKTKPEYTGSHIRNTLAKWNDQINEIGGGYR